MTTTPAPIEAAPQEDIRRGTLFTLIVIPVGIALWLLLWNVGIVASIVSFLIAWGAGTLYRFGARRITSTAGVWRVVVIVVVTVVAALIAGYAWDILGVYRSQGGIEFSDAIVMPEFWQDTFHWMFDGSNAFQLIISIAFAALGCFRTLRGLIRTARAAEAQAAQLRAVQQGTAQPGYGPQGWDQQGFGRSDASLPPQHPADDTDPRP